MLLWIGWVWMLLVASVGAAIVTAPANATHTVYWKPGGEGIFSVVLQLKALRFAVTHSNVKRQIAVVDFASAHYAGTVRLCDIFDFPSDIFCVREYSKNCTKDIKFLGSFTSGCYAGDPTWNDISVHRLPEIKREIAVSDPRINFQAKYLEMAAQVKVTLRIPAGKPFHVVHWRRRDQLTTRCIRDIGLVDRSLNCANASTFVQYLLDLRSRSPAVPLLVSTNEEDEAALRQIEATGVRVVPRFVSDIVEQRARDTKSTLSNPPPPTKPQPYLLGQDGPSVAFDLVVDRRRRLISSEVDLHNDRRLAIRKRDPKRGSRGDKLSKANPLDMLRVSKVNISSPTYDPILMDVTDIIVDAILMLEAQELHAFGASFIHDVLESERMLRNQSFCREVQSVGSFCHSLTLANYTSSSSSLLEVFRGNRAKKLRSNSAKSVRVQLNVK